jgi:hypothetical protein
MQRLQPWLYDAHVDRQIGNILTGNWRRFLRYKSPNHFHIADICGATDYFIKDVWLIDLSI